MGVGIYLKRQPKFGKCQHCYETFDKYKYNDITIINICQNCLAELQQNQKENQI